MRGVSSTGKLETPVAQKSKCWLSAPLEPVPGCVGWQWGLGDRRVWEKKQGRGKVSRVSSKHEEGQSRALCRSRQPQPHGFEPGYHCWLGIPRLASAHSCAASCALTGEQGTSGGSHNYLVSLPKWWSVSGQTFYHKQYLLASTKRKI